MRKRRTVSSTFSVSEISFNVEGKEFSIPYDYELSENEQKKEIQGIKHMFYNATDITVKNKKMRCTQTRADVMQYAKCDVVEEETIKLL